MSTLYEAIKKELGTPQGSPPDALATQHFESYKEVLLREGDFFIQYASRLDPSSILSDGETPSNESLAALLEHIGAEQSLPRSTSSPKKPGAIESVEIYKNSKPVYGRTFSQGDELSEVVEDVMLTWRDLLS